MREDVVAISSIVAFYKNTFEMLECRGQCYIFTESLYTPCRSPQGRDKYCFSEPYRKTAKRIKGFCADKMVLSYPMLRNF